MDAGRSGLVHPERRLPDLALPSPADGAAHRLRAPGRRSPVLVLVHGHGCAACGAFLHAVEAERDEIEGWDGRVLVIVPESPSSPSGGAGGGAFPVLVDAERRLEHALSVVAPAVVIADPWGEVHAAHEAGEEHRFLGTAEIVSWLRYLAVQCPECQGEAF